MDKIDCNGSSGSTEREESRMRNWIAPYAVKQEKKKISSTSDLLTKALIEEFGP